jgi:hypothetical protein
MTKQKESTQNFDSSDNQTASHDNFICDCQSTSVS